MITIEDNEMLTSIPDAEEIVSTLGMMNANKAPNPYGTRCFSLNIFGRWLGWTLFTLFRISFVEGVMLTKLNRTNIALILKVANPAKVSQIRQISLCNVIYKLISKLLVERLKKSSQRFWR